MNVILHSLWAKAEGGHYHPLLWHMMDAAAVAEIMWREGLGAGIRGRLAGGLGLTEEHSERWVPFIVGLHDLGKASQAFQGKREPLASRLREQGVPWNPAAALGPHHGLVTAATLADTLEQAGRHFILPDYGTTYLLAQVLGGHHGIFPAASEIISTVDLLAAAERSTPAWRQLRAELARHLAAVAGLSRAVPSPVLDPLAPDNPAMMLLAGLTVIADWLASNPDFFPFRPEVTDAEEYLALARQQAEQALTCVGWGSWRPPQQARSFLELFPFLSGPPRPVQSRAMGLEEHGHPPRLVIIEVPMGEGKTEAAMLLQDGWAARLKQRGAYFALPTMATSNQMFSRVRHFIRAAYPGVQVDLHLLHGHALLSDEYRKLKIKAVDQDARGDGEGGIIAGEWFTQRKRGLLAPFAVGTVDQALLAVLQTRHGFLRLAGLAEKTIIFDEVHAYDTYMLTLFERLLRHLLACPAHRLDLHPVGQLPHVHPPASSIFFGFSLLASALRGTHERFYESAV